MQVYELRESFGFEHLFRTERPLPEPGPLQVRMHVRAMSLNYRDLLVIRGQYNARLPLPRIPLSDAAGVIDAVGPGVTRVKVGQRVCGLFMPDWTAGRLPESGPRTSLGAFVDGVLAEAVVLPEHGVVSVPPHLTDEEAATLPCAAVTAWNALVCVGHVTAGETVLIQGTGGVSLFALQFARLLGARVIGTSSSDAKLKRAKTLGLSDGVNYRTVPDWGEAVRKLADGIGVDHVVEVGGAGTMPQSLRAVRSGGAISLIGVLAGGAGEFNPTPLLMKNVRLQGIFVGSGEMFAAMNRAITFHRLQPVIDRVFPFTEAVAALRHLESGSHFGKVVIKF
jgi:NADPH:quinone reductase-like Zn-dependent oxidoreductase